MDDEGDFEIIVQGCAYTPEYDDAHHGTNLKYDEIDCALTDHVKGLPCFIKHDAVHEKGTPRQPIGKIVDAYVNGEGELMTLLHISGDPVVLSLSPSKLIQGQNNKRFYNGLSLGSNVVIHETEKFNTKIYSKTPTEVSIVREGDRPKAKILNCWMIPTGSDVKKLIPDLIGAN